MSRNGTDRQRDASNGKQGMHGEGAETHGYAKLTIIRKGRHMPSPPIIPIEAMAMVMKPDTMNRIPAEIRFPPVRTS